MTVCGDGEYIVYTALAWRNKSFGQALEFVWSADSNEYVVRESASKVKIFKDFKVGENGGGGGGLSVWGWGWRGTPSPVCRVVLSRHFPRSIHACCDARASFCA